MPSRRLAAVARATLVYNLAVIVWGAYVRASFSGNGCGEHWPLCNGEVIPHAQSTQMLVELAHRATSGVALISVVALALLAWRDAAAGHPVRRAAWASVGFMLTEALLGAGLVLFGLVNRDASPLRAVAMSLHLVNTLLLLGAITLADFWAHRPDAQPLDSAAPLGALLKTALFLVPAVAVAGAVAALGDTLFPARSLSAGIAQDFSPLANYLLKIRLAHPALALTAAAVMLGACAAASRAQPPSSPIRDASAAVAALVLVQLAAGFLNWVLLAPIPLQLMHLLLADLVWVALIRLAAHTRSAEASPHLQAQEAAPWAL